MLKFNIIKHPLFWLTLSVIVLSACSIYDDSDGNDGNGSCVDVNRCVRYQSDISCQIEVDLTPAISDTSVLLEIFDGTVERGQIVYREKVNQKFLELYFPCGTSYSARATYQYKTSKGNVVEVKSVDGGDAYAGTYEDCDYRTCYREPLFDLDLDVGVSQDILDKIDEDQ